MGDISARERRYRTADWYKIENGTVHKQGKYFKYFQHEHDYESNCKIKKVKLLRCSEKRQGVALY